MPYTRMPASLSRLGPVRGALSDRMAYSTAIVECHAEKCKLRKLPNRRAYGRTSVAVSAGEQGVRSSEAPGLPVVAGQRHTAHPSMDLTDVLAEFWFRAIHDSTGRVNTFFFLYGEVVKLPRRHQGGYQMAAQYDVVIIGAGHNGLVASTYLARAGLRVLLLERREMVGEPASRKSFSRATDCRVARISVTCCRKKSLLTWNCPGMVSRSIRWSRGAFTPFQMGAIWSPGTRMSRPPRRLPATRRMMLRRILTGWRSGNAPGGCCTRTFSPPRRPTPRSWRACGHRRRSAARNPVDPQHAGAGRGVL